MDAEEAAADPHLKSRPSQEGEDHVKQSPSGFRCQLSSPREYVLWVLGLLEQPAHPAPLLLPTKVLLGHSPQVAIPPILLPHHTHREPRTLQPEAESESPRTLEPGTPPRGPPTLRSQGAVRGGERGQDA